MQENKLLITSEIHEWLRWKVVFAQRQIKCSARLPWVAPNVARWRSWPRSSSIKHLLTLHHAGDGCLSASACLINHILGPGSLVQRLGFWLCCCFTIWSVYWIIEDRIDCIKPLHFKYVGQVWVGSVQVPDWLTALDWFVSLQVKNSNLPSERLLMFYCLALSCRHTCGLTFWSVNVVFSFCF